MENEMIRNLLLTVGTLTGAASFAMGTPPLYTDVNYTDLDIQASNGITFGDVDGDGIIDMVTSDQELGVGIHIGVGDGTFGARTDYTMGPETPNVYFSTEAVELGDLNGDGAPDIVIAGYGEDEGFGPINFVDSGVHFRLNNGDGTFGTLTSLAGLLDTLDLTIADLDGDNDLDIVATEFTNTIGLYYWLNNGSASFGPRQQVSVGLFSAGVDAGDFNGDGYTDLAVIRVGDNVLDVALNNGNGTFASPVSYAVSGTNPGAIDLGDADNDGDLDIALTATLANQLEIFSNNGAGVFSASQTASTSRLTRDVRFADIDDDGDLDVLTSSSEDREINYHLNNGAGVFGARQVINTGGAGSIAVADLNDDGLIDLGMANIRFGSGYTVRLNTPDGLDGARMDYSAVANPRTLAFLDFNNDNKIDIATAGGNTGVAVLINAGDGSYPTMVNVAAGSVPRVTAGDINSDTFPDLVMSNFSTDNMTVLINDTAGGFNTPVSYPVGDGPQYPVLADFDGDGDLDFASSVTTSTANGFITVLTNNGSGVFGSPTSYPIASYAIRLEVGDVNNDGSPDLVAPKQFGSAVGVLINNGSGVFAAPVDYTTDSRPGTVALGDVDDDGDLDLVTANDTFPQTATVLFNNGSGVYGSRIDVPIDTDAEDVELTDIDDDGDLDLLATNPGVAGYTILLNDGTGVFTHERDYLVGRLPNVLESADLNEDGVMDIVVAQSSGFVSVHLGALAGAAPCPADFTGDGTLDIFDVFAFLDAFNNADPSADFTGDGSFDIFDVFAFLDAFNAGC